jgi:ABC-type Fe3+ transport system permease subunit
MNKKYVIVVALILVSLAVLIPVASKNPDALDSVTDKAATQQQGWQGIMPEYTISAIGDSYVTTLAAGSVGTIIVLAAGLLIGKMVTKKNP